MATDPGDLVLDPTCGSGTTATVARRNVITGCPALSGLVPFARREPRALPWAGLEPGLWPSITAAEGRVQLLVEAHDGRVEGDADGNSSVQQPVTFAEVPHRHLLVAALLSELRQLEMGYHHVAHEGRRLRVGHQQRFADLQTALVMAQRRLRVPSQAPTRQKVRQLLQAHRHVPRRLRRLRVGGEVGRRGFSRTRFLAGEVRAGRRGQVFRRAQNSPRPGLTGRSLIVQKRFAVMAWASSSERSGGRL